MAGIQVLQGRYGLDVLAEVGTMEKQTRIGLNREH